MNAPEQPRPRRRPVTRFTKVVTTKTKAVPRPTMIRRRIRALQAQIKELEGRSETFRADCLRLQILELKAALEGEKWSAA
jgi:hypothetical protein